MERRLFTCAEYMKMAELELFEADERLELLNGEIIKKVPHTPIHAAIISVVTKVFALKFRERCHFRSQMPLELNVYNMPEPDGAMIAGEIRDFADAHPKSALLAIEVSEETIHLDRTTKLEIYAQGGIAEYWIVNINDRVLEVYREPAPISGMLSGYGYRSVRHYAETEEITPLFASETSLKVSALLP